MLLATTAAAALVASGTATASAASTDDGAPPAGAVVQTGDTDGVSVLSIASLEDSLQPLFDATAQDPILSFDANAAVAAGADPQAVADWASVLQAAGASIAGQIPAAASAPAESVVAAAAACTGRSGFTGYYPSGLQVALNSCQTDQLMAAIGAGAGAAAAVAAVLVAAGVPQGAAVTAAVAALIAANVGFIATCKAFSSNGGIYLNGGQFPVLPPTCWGQ